MAFYLYDSFIHPYQYEIESIEYPPRLFKIAHAIMYGSLEDTSLEWIDTLEQLKKLCALLDMSSEIAVDLEVLILGCIY